MQRRELMGMINEICRNEPDEDSGYVFGIIEGRYCEIAGHTGQVSEFDIDVTYIACEAILLELDGLGELDDIQHKYRHPAFCVGHEIHLLRELLRGML